MGNGIRKGQMLDYWDETKNICDYDYVHYRFLETSDSYLYFHNFRVNKIF